MNVTRAALVLAGDQVRQYAEAATRVAGWQFVAAVESDASAASEVARGLGAELSATSLDRLLADHSNAFDAVVILGPLARRGDLVCRAAEAGKHVLVSSPLTASVEEARRATRACRLAEVRLMVNAPLRFSPYQTTVKSRLDAGHLGTPGLLRIHHWAAGGEVDGPASSPTAASPGNSPAAAAATAMLALEALDLACWLFDAAPSHVYATTAASDAAATGLQIHLGFPCGGMALIDREAGPLAHAHPYYALTLIGSRGAAYADDHHNTNLLFKESGAVPLPVGQGREHLPRSLHEFQAAICEGRDPSSTGEQFERVLMAVDACAASWTSRQAVSREGGRYEPH